MQLLHHINKKLMNLQFLNELKKEDKELRRQQNKRYRQKHREILNLKKQRAYHKVNLEKKYQKK
ncbi:hypothetical protein [Nitrosopumilus sp. Nsub]|uniref:hypothetical protein n=1 Tax=Nitrosopumilus sp. Nsub TaxID=1776294 RepID=UPI0012E3A755|nr:hypothetical protein [Nitrosopumilus sp. Nsub]